MDREKSEKVWVDGFSDWAKIKGSRGKGKFGKIQTYFQSKSHKAALLEYAYFCCDSEHVDLLLDENKRSIIIEEDKTIKKQRDVLIMLFDITRTIARQGIAFRKEDHKESNFDQIVYLVSRYNTTLKAWLSESERNKRPFHTTYMSYMCQ